MFNTRGLVCVSFSKNADLMEFLNSVELARASSDDDGNVGAVGDDRCASPEPLTDSEMCSLGLSESTSVVDNEDEEWQLV